MALPETIDYGDLDKALKTIGFTGNPSIRGFRLDNDEDGAYYLTVTLANGYEYEIPITATVASPSFGPTPRPRPGDPE